jgi:probable HAF family extracellular repeat protein
MVDLGTLGGSYSYAAAVNDHGQVVGYSGLANGTNHAFSWTAAGGMVDLGTLGGSSSYALAVDENGKVVGGSDLTGNRSSHAFSWTAAGGMRDLGTLGRYSLAIALNGSGQVTGQSGDLVAGDNYHAFSWTAAGGMVDLGTLGGSFTKAEAMNDHGQVVGWGNSHLGNFIDRPFSWTAAGGMVDLGTLGGSDGFALDVNEHGQVVGNSDLVDNSWHATLWNTGAYDFRFSGVKQPPAFNEVVAGRAVAVSFSLGGNFGLAILDGAPAFDQIACGPSVGVGPIAPASSAPAGSVIYKPAVDRYAYATKTNQNWAGSCRSLTLRLDDGSSHVVYFSFK